MTKGNWLAFGMLHRTRHGQKLMFVGSIGVSCPSTSLHTICCSMSMMQSLGKRVASVRRMSA
jgi:hypothetical protein